MKPSALFVIASDPRRSHRPAEAIRIAAGVGSWRKADVAVYLRGPAILALGEDTDALVDEDNFSRYLPLVQGPGRPIYVQQGAPPLVELGGSPWRFEAVSDAQLATMMAQSDFILHF